MAELAGQLGYRVTVDELAARLPAVTASDSDTLLVAADERDVPVGWIHVEVKRTLLVPLSAQVMGLVVDEAARAAASARGSLRGERPGRGNAAAASYWSGRASPVSERIGSTAGRVTAC
jgi:hypothetical protein